MDAETQKFPTRLASLEEALRPFARIARALERGGHGTLKKDAPVTVHSPKCNPIDPIPFSAFLAAEQALAEVRIRRRLDQHYSLYEAEKWLTSPQKFFDGDVPLDLIRCGRGYEIERCLDKIGIGIHGGVEETAIDFIREGIIRDQASVVFAKMMLPHLPKKIRKAVQKQPRFAKPALK